MIMQINRSLAIIAVMYLVWLTAGLSYQTFFYADGYQCEEMSIDMHDRLSDMGIDSYYAGYVGYGERPAHVWVVVCVSGVEIPFETTNGVGIPTHPLSKYVSPDVVFGGTDEMVGFDRW